MRNPIQSTYILFHLLFVSYFIYLNFLITQFINIIYLKTYKNTIALPAITHTGFFSLLKWHLHAPRILKTLKCY